MVSQFKDPILNAKAHMRRANEFDPDYWIVRQDRIPIDEAEHFEIVGTDTMLNLIYEFHDVFCNYQDLRWLKFGDYLYPCAMNKYYLLKDRHKEEDDEDGEYA